ncbi:hypothetical protein W97_00526 [Coniosporium apollinis CBS 100218]|uniref:Uncharacterized protein n=1 Tax=Coniosporium apollinis (strain CBS 100218) TaxID=1168221 RepID=R7YHE3_CONA1|nr:uncharacterized protein W97_00526 [Coniosporium apollinis CBS 100218]EON61313.1 hypothetical protein W97_00526 [Coniosporium apollinis CBS 100218]
MRSIIIHAKHHEYDIALSHLIEQRQSFISFYAAGGCASPRRKEDRRTTLSTSDSLEWSTTLPTDCSLSDEMVCDILTRWQGLRVLQDLYLESEPPPASYRPMREYRAPGGSRRRTPAQSSSGSQSITVFDPAYDTIDCGGRTFDAEQKQRFYRALTYLWLLGEYRWLLSHDHDQIRFDAAIKVDFDRKLQSHVREPLANFKQEDRAMLDALDALDVFEYLYTSLFPAHSSVIGTQLDCTSQKYDWRLPASVPDLDTKCALHRAAAVLRAPDIIEIVVRHKALHSSNQTSFDQSIDDQPSHLPSKFLYEAVPQSTVSYIGADRPRSDVFNRARSYPPLFDVSIYDVLQEEVVVKAKLLLGIRDFSWINTRFSYARYWVREARGKIFWWAQSNAKAEIRLRRWMEKSLAGEML